MPVFFADHTTAAKPLTPSGARRKRNVEGDHDEKPGWDPDSGPQLPDTAIPSPGTHMDAHRILLDPTLKSPSHGLLWGGYYQVTNNQIR